MSFQGFKVSRVRHTPHRANQGDWGNRRATCLRPYETTDPVRPRRTTHNACAQSDPGRPRKLTHGIRDTVLFKKLRQSQPQKPPQISTGASLSARGLESTRFQKVFPNLPAGVLEKATG